MYLTPDGCTESTYVQDIHYNAKGQRNASWYGNGTKTSYLYDALTYRLKKLCTVNLNTTPHPVVQKLLYWYDAAGNITQLTDEAQETVFYDNTVIRPEQKYAYDALYRLIEATGRELIGDTTGNAADNYNDSELMTSAVSPFDGNALQNYTQHYEYDAVGNFTSLAHSAGTGSYTRYFHYNNDSNRLVKTEVGTEEYNYTHDTRGQYADDAAPGHADLEYPKPTQCGSKRLDDECLLPVQRR